VAVLQPVNDQHSIGKDEIYAWKYQSTLHENWKNKPTTIKTSQTIISTDNNEREMQVFLSEPDQTQ
jgi:CRISPR/Cas system-associated protein Cas10 (large subunit of type III CRISPR-Cas system)